MVAKKAKKNIIEENIELVQEEDNSDEMSVAFMETGDIGFDMVLSNGKGLPKGSSVLLWADPGCGKTTLVADMCKRLLKTHEAKGEEYKVLYIDSEGSRQLMLKLGLKPYMKNHTFIHLERSFRWRHIEPLYDAVLAGKGDYAGVKLIVIDSVNSILSDSNEEKSVADAEFGTRAKERSNFYTKYLPKCKEAGINTILISQVRQNQGAMLFGDKKKAAVSYADKHYVDIIIKCTALTSNKDSMKEVTTSAFGTDKITERYIMSLDPTSSVCKNRYETTYRCEVMVDKGVGIQNFYVLRKLLVYHGFLKESTGYYSFLSPLRELLEAPEKSCRKDIVHEILDKNAGKVVNFLKENNCYTVVAPDQVSHVAGDEDNDAEEEE